MHEHDWPEKLDEAFWNERYSSQTALWSGNPNPLLITETAELAPGSALDVGSGEGGDAIWLAKRGWKVTGLDLSVVAIERAAAHAEQNGVGDIEWQQADLLTWEPPIARYDLVSAQFMHLPHPDRDVVYRGLAGSVAPGGTLLVVGHHVADLEAPSKHPQLLGMFFTGDEIAALLTPGEWDIVTNAVLPRTLDEVPGEKPVHTKDVVFRARRR